MALMAPTFPGRNPAPTAVAPAKPQLPPDFAEFAAKGGYQVEPDGRVYTVRDGRKSYIPPWVVWQNSKTGFNPDGTLTKEGMSFRTPGSDPSSAWHAMYTAGGPFTKRSMWDSENGTYEGSVDWGTLLGTIAAGALIGGGFVAAAGAGGGSGAAGAGVGLGETGATTGLATGVGLPGAVGAPTLGAVGAGTGVGLGETGTAVGAGTGLAEQLPGRTDIPEMGDLVDEGSAIGNVGKGESTLDKIGRIYKAGTEAGKSTSDIIAEIIGAVGSGVGAWTAAEGNTQLQNAMLGLTANQQNIQGRLSDVAGQSAFETELMNRAREEGTQRTGALKDVYRSSLAQNPTRSPYNPTPARGQSDEYLSTLSTLGTQGASKLANPAQYDTDKMSKLEPHEKYTPYNPNTMTGAGGTDPSTMQTIGNWLSPTLSTVELIYKLLGR